MDCGKDSIHCPEDVGAVLEKGQLVVIPVSCFVTPHVLMEIIYCWLFDLMQPGERDSVSLQDFWSAAAMQRAILKMFSGITAVPGMTYLAVAKARFPVLVTPPRIKDIEFNEDDTKQYFIDKGFIEVKVGVAPFRTQSLKNEIQAKRKQYGLRHQVTRTIHAAMGDTLISIAMEISLNDPQFRLWDKGKLVVILSRTKRISKILLPP